MKRYVLMALVGTSLLLGCNQTQQNDQLNSKDKAVQAVNPVIGNVSFVEEYGKQPDPSTNEALRIRTHLKHVEQRLRSKDVSHLPAELKEKRKQMLDLLHRYRENGEFPRNYKYAGQRKPCFIDQNGNICAVGYLVEQTAGTKAARQINNQYQYAKIYDMESPALKKWVTNSGLTLRECAMIQPFYGSYRGTITPVYGKTSSALVGTNLALMGINLHQSANHRASNVAPIAGLITGAGQTTIGLLEFPENGGAADIREENLSMINIGVGAGSLILSTYNLLSGEKINESETTSWNLYSQPVGGDQLSVGIGFNKRF